MALLSVLTPVHAAGAGFLAAAGESVLGQELPPGWELEWVVQEDGPASEIVDQLTGDRRIQHAANGARLGAAATRNLALSRASGALLQNLDADDLLLPGSLATLINVFDASPSVHWAIGQADDLMPDGSRKTFPPDLPFGIVPAGVVNAWAIEHGANWPIHCAGVMYRTASVRALGGWAAVPFDEDLVMFAALSQITAGWFDESHTWLYRQHEGQLIRSDQQRLWSHAGRRIALQRAKATCLAGVTLRGTAVDDTPLVDVAAPMKSAADLD
jgi:glycosyltransferase involved in cell wall biosynthesis